MRRAVAAVAKAVGLGVVLALAVPGSALIHMGLGPPRRLLETRVNAVLAATFEGTVRVQRIGALGLTHVAGVDAEVLDPTGERVLQVRGARARFDTPALIRSLWRGGRLVVRVPELAVDGVEAVIEQDATGALGLPRALAPRSRAQATGGRGLELSAPRIHLGHLWAHGSLPAAPIVDVDVDDLAAAFASIPQVTTLDVERLLVRARGLDGLDPEGVVAARATLPSTGARQASARYEGRVGAIAVEADGSLTGAEVAASLHARAGDGELTASGTATLPEAPRTELTASAQVDARDLDVSLVREGAPRSRLTAALAASVVSRPGGDLSGTFDLQSQPGQVSGQLVPAANVRGELDGRSVRGSAHLAERGAPTTVQFSLQPRRLAVNVETTVPDLRAVPRAGPLGRGRAHLVAEGRVDLDSRRVTTDASVEVSGLELKGVQLARGVVTGSAEGTLEAPRFVARLLATGLRAGGYGFTSVRAGVSGTPRGLDLTADLAGDACTPGLAARARVATSSQGTRVDGDALATLGEAGRLEISATDVAVAGAATDPSAWRRATGAVAVRGAVDLARLRAHLPAKTLPDALASGLITLRGEASRPSLHGAPSLAADVELRGLALGPAAVPRGEIHVRVEDGALSAAARLEQADGYVDTRATAAVAWSAALAPRFDAARPVDVAVEARNLRASAALPFVQGVFSELDGRVDADAKIHVEPGGKDGQMTGAVALRDGVADLPQLGQRLRAVRGRVIMKPWGTLRLDDFSAEAATGKLTASAQAVLQGLALRSATARVHVARGESIPLTLEGASLGRASGDVAAVAKMSPDGERLDVDVEIPTLRVELPGSTGHVVQPLEPDPTVRIGVHTGGGFVALPLGPPPRKPRDRRGLAVHAVIALGRDVEVRRDTTVEVVATGRVVVDAGAETRVGGRIDLERGQLDLQGKRFTIDHGTVTFVGGDPEDPMVVVSAFWDAPDGTRVFADFSGHASAGKVELRSQPPLTPDEILALVVFGSSSTSVQAAGMAGGLLAQGLVRAISGITPAGVTARVDTSEADNPRPELEVQLSPRVTARLAYRLGAPPPGESPDRTELTLEWRFIRDWSLVGVVGDQGSTALELLWRHRY